MVKYSQLAIFWWIARSCLASSCPSTGGTSLSCPSNDPNGSFCSGESLSGSTIVTCEGGCPSAGNCNDHLAQIAISGGALCYQDSPTAGNAQCTYDCVSVKALNGSTLYPVGCSHMLTNSTGTPSSVILTGIATATASTPTPSPTKAKSVASSLNLTCWPAIMLAMTLSLSEFGL